MHIIFFGHVCLQVRMWQRDSRDRTILQPTPAAAVDVSRCFRFLFFLKKSDLEYAFIINFFES